jgi:streptogramin lyase
MASYREYALPVNPPNPYTTYLHSLAPMLPADTTVCYTKYILGIIGILDLTRATKNVAEWTYPTSLLTTSMKPSANLTRLARDKTSYWAVAEDHHGALVRFVPTTGTFTRYSTPRAATPIVAPSDLMFDGTGMLWFSGCTRAALSTISRMDPSSGRVTSWPIPPAAMLNITTICPNAAGTRVWVSSVDLNVGSKRYWIGVLDVASGDFQCFAPKIYNGDSPRVMSLRQWERADETAVWFTAAPVTGSDPNVPAIYRTDYNGDVFHKYEASGNSWPRHVALEPGGTAWVSDYAAGSLVRCEPEACSRVPFVKRRFKLKPTRQALTATSARAKPMVSTAPMRTDAVHVIPHKCTSEYTALAMRHPDDIQFQGGGTTPLLAFVNWGDNTIGLLKP